jgi:Asp-tRNA(Asn)/Glu-tRNA(Gln) amidotransferase B subunit
MIRRLCAQYGITEYLASVLADSPQAVHYFERVAGLRSDVAIEPTLIANWIVNFL